MFIRRLFYNPETGETLYSYMMQGDIKYVSAETVAAQAGLTNYTVMEWTTPDDEIEKNFSDSFGRVSVNIETCELVFDFSPLPEPETPESDMLNALLTLGYTEE